MKKYLLKFCFLLTVIAALLISCSKEDNGESTPAAIGLTVFKNKTGDVNANTLQAQYKDPKFDIYFYGNFDANNDPTVIKTVTFQKVANDTIMDMTIDPTTFRITSASTTVKGVKQAVVMKFEYLDNGTNDFNVSYYSYDWTTQTGQLFYSTLVENKNGVTIGKPNYAAKLSGTKAFDYKLALESLLISTKIVTAGVVLGALLPEAALITAASVLIPGVATGLYFDVAVSTLIKLVIGDAKASDFFPPKTLITNPIIDTNNPIPHLQISNCVNTNISFTATMDATGAIIFTTINGGQAPYTYMVASGFQQSTVFANNYANGSYILAVKDANGCVNMKVIPLSRTTLAVGYNYQGGIIGYLDGTGLHGLIVAPSDQGTTGWGEPKDNSQTFNVVTSTDIGTGNANTIALSAVETYAISAAKLCADLNLGGYEDWYLPSRDELYQVVNNLKLIGFTKDRPYYISSSHAYSYSGNAYFVYFMSDTQIGVNSGSWTGDFRVRAVRSF